MSEVPFTHAHSTLHQRSPESDVNRLPLSTHIMGSSEVVVKCGNSCAILCTWGSRFLDTPGTTRKNPEKPGRTRKNPEKRRKTRTWVLSGFFRVLPGFSGRQGTPKKDPLSVPLSIAVEDLVRLLWVRGSSAFLMAHVMCLCVRYAVPYERFKPLPLAKNTSLIISKFPYV